METQNLLVPDAVTTVLSGFVTLQEPIVDVQVGTNPTIEQGHADGRAADAASIEHDPQWASLDMLAELIRTRRLEAPVSFLLEAHRPLSGVAYHLLVAVEPVARWGVRTQLLDAVKKVLESEAALNYFLEKLRRP